MSRHVQHDRRAALRDAAAQPADLLVIGGGIVGAGIARDAAMRGIRTVLVEQRDLGWGTSSRSSRLIHGGLRYLEHYDLPLVIEALRERTILRRIAPHLVRPLPFIFPLQQDGRIPRWKLAAGMWLYDALSLFRNVSRHRMLGKRALLSAEPALKATGILGGARYWDAQCDDARLVVATARSAHEHGARILTYAGATALLSEGGRVAGAVVRCAETRASVNINAAVVVNATGPWSDRVRRLEDSRRKPMLRLTKGVHVVVPRDRIGNHDAVTLTSPIDGRVMFVLPWGEWSYIGTTDTDTQESPDDVAPAVEDVRYLLRSANAHFPNARLNEHDVIASWAALRPLVDDGEAGTDDVSREHVIAEGPGGMITIAGGKLTTYRLMAAQVVNLVTRKLPPRNPPLPSDAGTDVEALPGGESAELSAIRELSGDTRLEPETIEHLLRHYGTEAAGIFNLVRHEPLLAERLQEDHPAVGAEVVHAARKEFARTVADVLVRRVHLFYETRDQGSRAAPRTAALLARELGWQRDQADREVAAYRALTGRQLGAAPGPVSALTFIAQDATTSAPRWPGGHSTTGMEGSAMTREASGE